MLSDPLVYYEGAGIVPRGWFRLVQIAFGGIQVRRMIAAIALGALGSSAVFAAGACTGPNTTNGGNTLNIYDSLSSGGDINSVVISNGTLLPVDTTGTCVVAGFTFSNFQVDAGVGFANNTPFNLSLTIAANEATFQYTNLGAGDIELFFQLSPGLMFLTLQNGTSTAISENVCSAGILSPPNSTCPMGTQLAQLTTNGQGNSIDGPILIGSATTDFIVKNITGGGDNTDSFASGVPEPMSLSLMGLGLLGIGLLGRRARRKS